MTESLSVVVPSSALIAGCGYVGLRTARLWQAQGISTFAITRSAVKAEQLQAEDMRPVILDLGSSAEWQPLPDVDFVLWSVGFDHRPGSDRKSAWIDGLTRLLAALPPRSQPRRIIYTSSTGVYGEGDGQDADELTRPNPGTEGGVACVAAEQILQQFARDTGTQVSILRLAGIYGPDRLLRRVSELRERVPLAIQPDEWLNLIHVDDAVRVIEYARKSDVWPGWCQAAGTAAGIMNVVAADSVTRRTYYSLLAQLVSAPEPVFKAPNSEAAAPGMHRRGRDNRRVISRIRPMLPIEFQFDDCTAGLTDAVARSANLM